MYRNQWHPRKRCMIYEDVFKHQLLSLVKDFLNAFANKSNSYVLKIMFYTIQN